MSKEEVQTNPDEARERAMKRIMEVNHSVSARLTRGLVTKEDLERLAQDPFQIGLYKSLVNPNTNRRVAASVYLSLPPGKQCDISLRMARELNARFFPDEELVEDFGNSQI